MWPLGTIWRGLDSTNIGILSLCLNCSDPGEAPDRDRRHGEAEAKEAPAESVNEAENGERYVVKATPMDQLKKVADGDETSLDPKAEAAEAEEGAGGNDTAKVDGGVDDDGGPGRFYHTVSMMMFAMWPLGNGFHVIKVEI